MKIKQKSLPLFDFNEFKIEQLPTNVTSNHYRIQRWGNFIAGYSIEFVEKCLAKHQNEKDVVLDPFLGCGTTLIASKNLGFKVLGLDQHPVFYTIAIAKSQNYTIEELNIIKYHLLNSQSKIQWSSDAQIFLKKLFCDQDLERINKASASLPFLDHKIRALAITFFLKSCEVSCCSQTDGIYKAPTSKKSQVNFEQAIENTYQIFYEDINSNWYKNEWIHKPLPICYNQSSTNMKNIPNSSVGICITSPPYLNNFDFAEMTRMQLYLLGWATSWNEISEKIRNNLITNTTTALKNKKTNEYQNTARISLPLNLLIQLDPIVDSLKEEQKNRAGKKTYNFLIYPYYAQINQVLLELYRVLKKGGIIHWVIADSALYGIHIKTHLHTAILMNEIGFKNVQVDFIRQRGHRWILRKRDGAKEGLGEYHITAIK